MTTAATRIGIVTRTCRPFYTSSSAARLARPPSLRLSRDVRAPTKTPRVPWRGVRAPPVLSAIGFTVGGSALVYTVCGAWSSERTARLQGEDASFFMLSSLLGRRRNLELAVQEERAHALGRGWQHVRHALSAWPALVREGATSAYASVAEWYLRLPPYQQAALPIIGVNTLVFSAWLVSPAFRGVRWMRRYFTHRPSSGRLLTLLTSAFSHRSLPHFALNNLALFSVGSSGLVALQTQRPDLLPDADSLPHMLAFFVAAGVTSSLVSHLVVAAQWRRAYAHRATALLAALSKRASLGSSGAIYAAFSLCALALPQLSLRCVSLSHAACYFCLCSPCRSSGALAGTYLVLHSLLVIDALGVLRGWRVFDHVAHLGGAAFGAAYYALGAHAWSAAYRAPLT